MKTERSFKDRRKKGVSPVIGVILMVAATIVIAAVVLAMLGGFTPPRQNYIVTASASTNSTGTGVFVTYQGGPDSLLVTNVQGSVNGLEEIDGGLSSSVGSSATFAGTPGTGNDHVVVNATFTDTSVQVILDTFV
jgi:flagellin-like protein